MGDRYCEKGTTASRHVGRRHSVYATVQFFIHVDKGVLQSVVDRPNIEDFHHDETGFVNLVDARLTPASYHDIDEDHEPECLEPIDGCTEENVGWMRISAWMLGWVAYARFQNPNFWYVLYKRPQR